MIKRIVKYLKEPDRLFERLSIFIKMQFRFKKKNEEYWNSLKDKYKGKRGFVIGNGPSLKMSDLDQLKGEVTIASNKIYLSFQKTDWRPSFVTVADPLVWKKIKNIIGDYIPIVHISNYLNSSESNANTIYWKARFRKNAKGFTFSDDMGYGAYSGSTVTYENIQFAVHLGLNPIYLIGCDHNYPGENNVKPGVAILQSEEKTHFIDGYRSPGEAVLPAPIQLMEAADCEARAYADSMGTEVYNATRGGKLEIFERADIGEIFLNNLQSKDTT